MSRTISFRVDDETFDKIKESDLDMRGLMRLALINYVKRCKHQVNAGDKITIGQTLEDIIKSILEANGFEK